MSETGNPTLVGFDKKRAKRVKPKKRVVTPKTRGIVWGNPAHGHRLNSKGQPRSNSLNAPALYDHLLARGMTKQKAAQISNGIYRKKLGKPPKSVKGSKGKIKLSKLASHSNVAGWKKDSGPRSTSVMSMTAGSGRLLPITLGTASLASGMGDGQSSTEHIGLPSRSWAWTSMVSSSGTSATTHRVSTRVTSPQGLSKRIFKMRQTEDGTGNKTGIGTSALSNYGLPVTPIRKSLIEKGVIRPTLLDSSSVGSPAHANKFAHDPRRNALLRSKSGNINKYKKVGSSMSDMPSKKAKKSPPEGPVKDILAGLGKPKKKMKGKGKDKPSFFKAGGPPSKDMDSGNKPMFLMNKPGMKAKKKKKKGDPPDRPFAMKKTASFSKAGNSAGQLKGWRTRKAKYGKAGTNKAPQSTKRKAGSTANNINSSKTTTRQISESRSNGSSRNKRIEDLRALRDKRLRAIQARKNKMRLIAKPKKKNGERGRGKQKDRMANFRKDDVMQFAKKDDDQQIVFGWAYQALDANGDVVTDLSGDFVDDPMELEKTAYGFVLDSRKGGYEHLKDDEGQVIYKSDMVESAVFTPEKIDYMGMAGKIPVGWWVGFKVSDDLWPAVKSGEITGFSIAGSGIRTPVEA